MFARQYRRSKAGLWWVWHDPDRLILPQAVIDALKPTIVVCEPTEQAITPPKGGFLRSNNWRRHPHWARASGAALR
jgi:hypothetical protein